MSNWTADELNKIGNADELRLATARPDGSLRRPVTIWVVRHGDDLYIRSYRGPGGSWFRRARDRREGRIPPAGWTRTSRSPTPTTTSTARSTPPTAPSTVATAARTSTPWSLPKRRPPRSSSCPPSWLPHRQRGQKPDDHETQARQP